jgi:hypothetical protein
MLTARVPRRIDDYWQGRIAQRLVRDERIRNLASRLELEAAELVCFVVVAHGGVLDLEKLCERKDCAGYCIDRDCLITVEDRPYSSSILLRFCHHLTFAYLVFVLLHSAVQVYLLTI